MNNKLQKYRKEKNKLIRNINKLNKQRENIIKKIKRLNSLQNKNKIIYNKYKIEKLLDNASLTTYLKNNLDKIEELDKKLYVINAKIKGADKNYIYKDLFLLSFILLFSLSYFYLDPAITGLTTLDKQLTFSNSTPVDLEINVTSLRLSGYLEGNGSAKIYLGDYLVLDSSFINQTLSQIQENITNNKPELEIQVPTQPDTFNIQPTITEEKTYFNDVCIETCDNINSNNIIKVEIEGNLKITITNSNYSIKIENITENQLQEDNLKIENQTFITPIENISNENILEINTTIFNLTIDSEELIQVKAELNKPVEWKLKTKNKSIELPLESTNINVNKIINETTEEKEKTKLNNVFGINSVPDKKIIEIDESNETQLEVTYHTKAPYSLESNLIETNNKLIKNITIKSDSELHYKNVLSYTNLQLEIQNINQVKLFHYVIKNISGGIGTNGSDYETENFNKSFIKIDITNNNLYNLTYQDTNNNSLIDRIYWNTLELSEQKFSVEISLTIITIQSYPTVGGNWTVLFNTTGTANLTIKAINGTTWSELNDTSNVDLRFIEIKCGNNIQNYQWFDNSVIIPNYSCNETASEISKVLTKGKHTLEFNFENITKYAYNIAGILNLTLNSPLNATTTTNLSVTLNITAETNATLLKELLIYAGNSTNFDYNNILYRNVSPINLQSNNITYNFSALPIKPDGTDGLVLLYHFDNITNYENATNGSNFTVYDWSLNNNNNNNGTGATNSSNGGPQFNVTGGKFGGAFDFDGEDDYINISDSNSLDISNSISLSAWIKPGLQPTTRSIISKGKTQSVYKIAMVNNKILIGGVLLSINTDLFGTTNAQVSEGKWNHIAMTFDGNYVKMYINGNSEIVGTVLPAENIKLSNEDLLIGDGQDGLFNGTIDEVAIWNRTLSDTEIAKLYNLTYGKYYWKANATDLAGNVNNTAIQEFSITSNEAPLVTQVYPDNNTFFNTAFINFTYNVTNPDPIANCTLYIDSSVNSTDSIITKSTNQTINITMQDKTFEWFASCRNTGNVQGNSSIRKLTIDTKAPNLSLDYPFNISVIINNSVSLNVTANDTISNITSLYVFTGNSTNLDYNSIVYINNTLYNTSANYDITYNFTSLPIKPDGTDGLVLLYHFDNITNFENASTTGNFTIYDWSGNGNNGSCNGGGSACPNWNLSQAKFGGAFEFDSSNDYIALPQSLLNGVSRGTISIWYNRHTFTGTTADNFPIFAYGGQDTDEYMIIYVDTDSGTFVFRKDAGLTNANFICPDKNFTNIWTNIFVTWDNSQMQCFINGVFTNSLSGDFEPGISQDTRLAGISNRVDYDFDGLLDEVAIWNRSLSSKEIHDMYNLNYRRYYWKANATDLAGNVNNTAIQEFNITLHPANATPFIFPNPAYANSSLNASSIVTDPDADSMTVEIVFWNGTREHFRTNITNVANGSNISYTLIENQTNNITKNENWTVSFKTFDGVLSSSWVNSSILISNIAPDFNETILNSTFAEDTNLTNVTDIDEYFSDKDSDNLTFSVSGNSAITVLIDTFNNLSYIPSPNWYGQEDITITANDGTNRTSSNIITITVNNADEEHPSVTSVSGKSTQLVGFDILGPSPVSLSSNDKVVIPIIIRNNKNLLLTNLKLSAESSSDQLNVKFKEELIPVLAPGTQAIANLEITSSGIIKEDRYSIVIKGQTAENIYDIIEFFVNIAEFGSSKKKLLIPRLQVAFDLFNSNPQCLELNELLNQAESSITKRQFEKAESLIENAIKGCNELISFVPQKIETQVKKPKQNLILTIEIAAFVILVSSFVLYRKYKKRKIF